MNTDKTKYDNFGIRRNLHDLCIEGDSFEAVEKFGYLGNITDNKGCVSSTVQYRIQAGNMVYYANRRLLRSKLINRNAKMRIYNTLVRPVVVYGGETWTLVGRVGGIDKI